jgi:hypothetical protein
MMYIGGRKEVDVGLISGVDKVRSRSMRTFLRYLLAAFGDLDARLLVVSP